MFSFEPLENVRKPLIFWICQGDYNGTLRRIGLIIFQIRYGSVYDRMAGTCLGKDEGWNQEKSAYLSTFVCYKTLLGRLRLW